MRRVKPNLTMNAAVSSNPTTADAFLPPEPIADYACHCGEGPLWHPDEQALYWTDIPTGRLFRYDAQSGTHEQVFAGESVGGMTLQADGSLLLFMARGAVKIRRPDGSLETVLDEIPDERETRFNDVIADPEGRVFCGTMSTKERKGRLYRLDTDGTLTIVRENVGCSNGMGFTPDLSQMYFTDTPTREIIRFDYDRQTGALMNEAVFATISSLSGEGSPDGMTVDKNGDVWSARWGGARLVCHDQKGGHEKSIISFPCPKVSCALFGGPDYADLYVTTAGGAEREKDGPSAGILFRLRPDPDAQTPPPLGVPEFRSRIGL